MNETRARGEGQIRAHGSKLQLRYYVRGQRVEERTQFLDSLDGRKKAEKLLRKRLGEVLNGIHQDSRSLRYEDLRAAYVADCETSQKKSLRHDSEGNSYLESVRRLDDFFSGCRIVEIDTDLMRKFQNELRAKEQSEWDDQPFARFPSQNVYARATGSEIRNLPYFPMLRKPGRGRAHCRTPSTRR